MKHEIEIEGLPEGWEASRLIIHGGVIDGSLGHGVHSTLLLSRKVRKYDWSKTLGDVLCKRPCVAGYLRKDDSYFSEIFQEIPTQIATVWQPNIHGECPVDPEASLVRVRLADGREREWDAHLINWSIIGQNLEDVVTAWQFIRLADGYEW